MWANIRTCLSAFPPPIVAHMAEPIIPSPSSLGPKLKKSELTARLGEIIPARFHDWLSTAIELGFHDFIAADDGFKSTLHNGEAWGNANATGVYFWVAEDGEMYVGKATRVISRLMSHRKKHPDLVYFSFQIVPAEDMGALETELIRNVQSRGHPTRNIKDALDTNVQVPFDDFVTLSERQDFLSGEPLSNFEWRDLPVLEQKHASKFSRLLKEPRATEILTLLRLYIENVIPNAGTTEMSFWSVSLYTQIHIIRINVGQQEVFTITKEGDELMVRPLTQRKFSWWPKETIYKTRCYDNAMPAKRFAKWLRGERLLASRELVIWLMRHTTTLNSGSHCPQVVRAAFD